MRALPVLLLAAACACAGPKTCPAPEAYAPLELTDWTGTTIELGLVARAPASCPGRRHPILRAVRGGADAWVHVVEARGEAFVDVSKADAEAGVPFYTRGAEFWDNPGWSQPRETLVWTGWAFPVRITGRRVEPLGGVRWGFRWEPAEKQPSPQAVEAAPRAEWARLRPVLAKYSSWDFAP